MKKILCCMLIMLISAASVFFLSTVSDSTLIIYVSEGYQKGHLSLNYCGKNIPMKENIYMTKEICEGHLVVSFNDLNSQPIYVTSGFNYLVEYRVRDNIISSKSNIFK